MTPKTILCVVGARPNFVKIAPLMRALQGSAPLVGRLVHTGQHYDAQMSDAFFEELDIPEPDLHLGVGSGTHAEQTGRVMIELEKVLLAEPPDLTLVVGDVNSTLAAALASAKLHIPVAHVEAGLRSGDRSMPEELNRLLTDQLADLLFTTEPQAAENLRREGIPAKRVHFVGNVMIDTLRHFLPRAQALAAWREHELEPRQYGLVTLHRPGNVDDPETLARLVGALCRVAGRIPLVFPLHPRTEARLHEFGLAETLGAAAGIHLARPLGYLQCLSLMSEARLVLTDSGGIQEETTALGVPCLTLRENTERPLTVSEGTNTLVGRDPQQIVAQAERVLNSEQRAAHCPELWDGRASERIVEGLATYLEGAAQDTAH